MQAPQQEGGGVVNLYKIFRDGDVGYDEYDEAIVAAESEDQARNTPPGHVYGDERVSGWCPVSEVKVALVGIAIEGTEPGVICASFNAG